MPVRIVLLVCLFAFPPLQAKADPTLTGTYRGSITYTPKDGATSYDDRNATMTIVPDTGKGPVASITYSDQTGRYREFCFITYNADGTVTLKGESYEILSGSSFYPDTFTVRIADDGSVSGTSVDSAGGRTVLKLHH